MIDEYVGRVNSKTAAAALRTCSLQGWVEPGQTPEFDEFTIALEGTVRVTHQTGTLHVRAGHAVIAYAGESVQYSTPESDGANIAVCLPAFSMESVHRDKASALFARSFCLVARSSESPHSIENRAYDATHHSALRRFLGRRGHVLHQLVRQL